MTVMILGGLQLMAIGIIGEYLGRLFIESKHRPLYLLEEYSAPQGGRDIGVLDELRREAGR